MPGSHTIWQLRQCSLPLIDTRHSKQIPIAQSAPRGSPLTEFRHGCPAIVTATATVAPEGTDIREPFTVSVTEPGVGVDAELCMGVFLRGSRGQIWLNRNFWFRARDRIHQNSRRCQ